MNGAAHNGFSGNSKSPPSDVPLTISEQFRRHSTMSHKIVIYIKTIPSARCIFTVYLVYFVHRIFIVLRTMLFNNPLS